MNVGTNYKLEADSLNITLSEKHKGKGKTYWKVLGYFSNPANALKELADLKLREDGLRDFKSIIKKQEEIYQLVSSLKLPVPRATTITKPSLVSNTPSKHQNRQKGIGISQ